MGEGNFPIITQAKTFQIDDLIARIEQLIQSENVLVHPIERRHCGTSLQ